jgi:hypothetical protein
MTMNKGSKRQTVYTIADIAALTGLTMSQVGAIMDRGEMRWSESRPVDASGVRLLGDDGASAGNRS